jgi:DNA-binding response OmpR family regulator
MDTSLTNRTILVVEDEPLIALDIANGFQAAGAEVALARSLADARKLFERDGICAAIVDFGLGDGDANELCERLNQKHVPYVLHSGYAHTGLASKPAAVIPKPASPDALVAAVCQLLGRQQ